MCKSRISILLAAGGYLLHGQNTPLEIRRMLRLDRFLTRMRKIGGQEGRCLAGVCSRNLLGSSLSHNQSALFAGSGTDVDDPIAAGDNVHTCSTTTTVLPDSTSSCSWTTSRVTSDGCRPVVGSSRT